MGRPPALKPFAIKVSPKTDSTGSIGIQMHVRGQGDVSVNGKGMSIPPGKEGFPYIKVLEKLFVKSDVVETVVYTLGKVDHTLQESSPWDDCFAGELQGTYK